MLLTATCFEVRAQRPILANRKPGRNGRLGRIVLKKSALLAESQHWVGRARFPSSGRRLRDRDQLGELAEVLGGGGEEELVLGTIRARRRRRSSFRIRLRWANSISTFFRWRRDVR